MNSLRKILIGKKQAEEKGAELVLENSGCPLTEERVGILLSSWRRDVKVSSLGFKVTFPCKIQIKASLSLGVILTYLVPVEFFEIGHIPFIIEGRRETGWVTPSTKDRRTMLLGPMVILTMITSPFEDLFLLNLKGVLEGEGSIFRRASQLSWDC